MSFSLSEVSRGSVAAQQRVVVQCAKSEIPIEDLRPGDRIVTRDNGLQKLRWIGARIIPAKMMSEHTDLNPVLIGKGALGLGLPHRDLRVSPERHILYPVDGPEGSRRAVAARNLIGQEGIASLTVFSLLYVHLMFDADQWVLANGTWSLCFRPSNPAKRSDGAARRRELFRLFPGLRTREGRVGRVVATLDPFPRRPAEVVFDD